MSVSQFQITLDGEEDLLDCLDLIFRNVDQCFECLRCRDSFNWTLNGFRKSEDLESANEKLVGLSKIYQRFDDQLDLSSIFSRSEVYLSKTCANYLLKMIQIESEDNLPVFLYLHKKIWAISKKIRFNEDRRKEILEENSDLKQSLKSAEMRFKELSLDLFLLKIEIDTQLACLTSLQWHQSSHPVNNL
jgi:hypothetical protein